MALTNSVLIAHMIDQGLETMLDTTFECWLNMCQVMYNFFWIRVLVRVLVLLMINQGHNKVKCHSEQSGKAFLSQMLQSLFAGQDRNTA